MVENITTCLVCCSDDLPLHRGISACGHNDVCGQCHIRLRYLLNDLKCPICKATNDRIIVDMDTIADSNESGKEEQVYVHKQFQDYEFWGDDDIGPGYLCNEKIKMFFKKDYQENRVLPLFQLACYAKGCNYGKFAANSKGRRNNKAKGKNDNNNNNKDDATCTKVSAATTNNVTMKSLRDHLRAKHSMTLCQLCVDNKRDFISNLPRYTPEQLKVHEKKGEGKGSGFTGHPMCEFCRPKRFYDLTKLHEHLNKEHYKCHVCEKQGLHNQFFKNYDKLAIHFDRQHFLCQDPQCLAARFVVFENEIDLRAHEMSVHGLSHNSQNRGTKINVEFRVRRRPGDQQEYNSQELPSNDDFQYGLNGEAFVPESLPSQQQQTQENEPDISDPVHAARTAELRAQASEIRQRQNINDPELNNEYPDLAQQASGGTSQPLNAGWTKEGRRKIQLNGRPTQDDFPTLGSTTSSNNNGNSASNKAMRKVSAKPRAANNLGATRQFASIASSARVTTPSYSNFPRPSSTPSMNNYTRTAAPPRTLTGQDFPSLGGASATSSVATPSGSNYARQIQRNVGVTNSMANMKIGRSASSNNIRSTAIQQAPTASDFPSLGGGSSSSNSNSYAAAEEYYNKKKKTTTSKVKGRGVSTFLAPKGERSAAEALASNILAPPPIASTFQRNNNMSPDEILQALKSILGPTNYKSLRKTTKEFALGNIMHEAYVDQVSSLFPEGKQDDDFWNFIPAIIESCPDDSSGRNSKAMAYLSSIRYAVDMAGSKSQQQQQQSRTPSSTNAYGSSSSAASTLTARYKTPQSTKNKWGGNSKNQIAKTSALLAKTKLPAGTSVMKDAAMEQPNKGGNATKGMKKLQKNEKISTVADNGKKKKNKKKKNDDLRNLAFGK